MLKKGTVLVTAFEGYTVKEQIGQGGNGTVFLVDSSDREPYAVKVINKSTTHRDKIKRFKNEINFCQKHRHPNIIKVIDYGVYKENKLDCLFYVMPYYDSTLRKEIDRGIDLNSAIPIFNQILEGIEFAHERNVWHRDIKPENILFDSTNQIMVIADFGVAHFCADEIITAVETKAHDRLANFTYSAPEQRIKGNNVDGRADIFALGLILNEMFTKTVISGSKYVKISDCYQEYAFLDQVVDELISQDPLSRIYPVRKILLEISTLAKLESDNEELKRITDKKLHECTEKNSLFVSPRIIDIEYKDKNLVIHLDKKTDHVWNNILIRGDYSHNSLYGYSTHVFKYGINIKDCTTFTVSISDENVVTTVIEYFQSWLPIVTNIYIQQVKVEIAKNLEKERQQREREIQEKKKEMAIREKLKSMLKSDRR